MDSNEVVREIQKLLESQCLRDESLDPKLAIRLLNKAQRIEAPDAYAP